MKFRDAWFSEKPEYWWILMARKGNVSQTWFNSSSEFVWICPDSINRLLSESLFASTISWVAPVCHELPLYRLPEQVIVSAIWMFSPLVLGSLGSTLAQVIFLDDFAHLHFLPSGLKPGSSLGWSWGAATCHLASAKDFDRLRPSLWLRSLICTLGGPQLVNSSTYIPDVLWTCREERQKHFFDSTGALQWHEKIRFFLELQIFLDTFSL